MQTPEEIARIRAACVENAEALLNAAKVVATQPGSNNIAHHLAALALEEVGKSSMIFMSSLRTPGDEERKRPVDWIEDHERKLFWAIFSLRMDGKNPTKGIQQAFEIAKHIHETRLATLYVDPADPDARKGVSDDDVQNLIRLTDAQINLEKLKKPREMSAEDRADLDWFFAATDDRYLKTIVFSKGSFEKQAEFGDDTLGWVRWLKGIIDENNRANIELAKREIDRKPPEGEEGHEDKYEITIRLRSWSHSIRQRPLSEWNKGIDKIRLYKGSGNTELLVKFILPKLITVQQVWPVGMSNSTLLVTAINIGTVGFIWWYLPEFVTTYADNVMDLENKTKMDLDRVPPLKVSWGNQALDSAELTQVRIVFLHIASVRKQSRFAVYTRYFKALALMAKNDIFFQIERNLLVEFHLVLQEAMAAYGDWDGNEDNYLVAVEKMMEGFKAGSDFVTLVHDLIGVAKVTMKGENKTRPVSLEDVLKLKAACDLYLIMKARIEVKKQVEAFKAQQGIPETTSMGEAPAKES
jgi:AbiV family abortive infection protein